VSLLLSDKHTWQADDMPWYHLSATQVQSCLRSQRDEMLEFSQLYDTHKLQHNKLLCWLIIFYSACPPEFPSRQYF